MIKILLSFMIFCLSLMVSYAKNLETIDYKILKNEAKISYDIDTAQWEQNTKKKINQNYFTKYISDKNISEYYNIDGTLAFSTGCEFDFLNNGNLICYSNSDLKFYDFTIIDKKVIKRPLSKEEVQILFPDFEIILISQFSSTTNSYKIKKRKSNLKVIILNDTENDYSNYYYTSGNTQFKEFLLKGFLIINKKGMIQFSKNNNNNWYVLLIR